jgi:plasmid maintenance system antidote protein VapI
LRKAVKALVQEAHSSSQLSAQQLESSLGAKLQSTKALQSELSEQLAKVQEEKSKQAAQRDSLRKSLQDKQ